MRKKEILFAFGFFLFVFLSFCVSAEKYSIDQAAGYNCEMLFQQVTTLKQGESARFVTSVLNNTGATSNILKNDSTSCNLILINKTDNLFSSNLSFNENTSQFYKVVDPEYFLTLGDFSYKIQCENSEGSCIVSGLYSVTNTGNDQTEAEGIAAASYLFLMIVLSFLFVFAGFKLSDGDLWPMGILFMVFSMFLIVYDFWLGYEYQFKYVGVDGSTAMPELFFWLISFLSIVGIWILIVLAIKKIPQLLEYIKYKKAQSEDSYSEDY